VAVVSEAPPSEAQLARLLADEIKRSSLMREERDSARANVATLGELIETYHEAEAKLKAEVERLRNDTEFRAVRTERDAATAALAEAVKILRTCRVIIAANTDNAPNTEEAILAFLSKHG
jgi:hypothetical protein